ncbi:MAG: hypothetical protein KJZ79_14555 [Bryobacteraceae bacterium]|nr:hypothetical protein [Bryobacteraceae bacterium]
MFPTPSASELLRLATCAVSAAESCLDRPVAQRLNDAGQLLETGALPPLQTLTALLQGNPSAFSAVERASLAEAAAALQSRIVRIGRLLDGAAQFYAAWAVEIAARRGYSAEGVALPLSVLRSAGRHCNLQA